VAGLVIGARAPRRVLGRRARLGDLDHAAEELVERLRLAFARRGEVVPAGPPGASADDRPVATCQRAASAGSDNVLRTSGRPRRGTPRLAAEGNRSWPELTMPKKDALRARVGTGNRLSSSSTALGAPAGRDLRGLGRKVDRPRTRPDRVGPSDGSSTGRVVAEGVLGARGSWQFLPTVGPADPLGVVVKAAGFHPAIINRAMAAARHDDSLALPLPGSGHARVLASSRFLLHDAGAGDRGGPARVLTTDCGTRWRQWAMAAPGPLTRARLAGRRHDARPTRRARRGELGGAAREMLGT